MKNLLKYSALGLALALGSSTFAHASNGRKSNDGWWDIFFPTSHNHDHDKRVAPEVDPGLALSGFALLGGTLAVLRSRRSQQS